MQHTRTKFSELNFISVLIIIHLYYDYFWRIDFTKYSAHFEPTKARSKIKEIIGACNIWLIITK